jgi:surfactin synthase thioesterase subunit
VVKGFPDYINVYQLASFITFRIFQDAVSKNSHDALTLMAALNVLDQELDDDMELRAYVLPSGLVRADMGEFTAYNTRDLSRLHDALVNLAKKIADARTAHV